MSEDYELWWPLADDQSCMFFCYGMITYWAGSFGRMLLWRRRRYIKVARLAPWGIPAGAFVFGAAYQALEPPARTFVWSLGTAGQLLPPYPDEDEA